MDVRGVTKGLSQFSIACGIVQALGSMAWAIWWVRNMWVHSNHVIDTRSVMEMMGRMLGNFQQCFRLEVPIVNTLVRMGKDEVGIGAIIRDSEDMVVAGFGRRVTGFFSPHIAECLALLESLSFDRVLVFEDQDS
ncbi:hypothetical protein TIFTF001_055735 [Ficus carica]|uniref:RNase H type-1 domain-containing protein n=1 Tax=Ficus carica TaxID=3494 RepID=A0AA88EF89_FICCA|nr:hypothetical protein TIFTF001_055735 [Ficus carica]